MESTTNHVKTRHDRKQPLKPSQKVPFIEHVHELRKRLFYIIVSVGVFSAIAYAFEHHIIAALLKPAKDQEFIYTSPGGGIDFLFRVCLYTGIACSIPVIVYQLLRYVEPLIKHTTKRMVFWGSLTSGFLALVGVVFGYFVGLPSGLDFLLHQFRTDQIQPLITIQSYMSFVLMYLLGSAMLLQIPLILLFINRIKPLKPQKLLSFSVQRWVILVSFVGSAIINANPHLVAQLLIATPLILSYQVGVGIIWYINRKQTSPEHIAQLRTQDAALRANRLRTAQYADNLVAPAMKAPAITPKPSVTSPARAAAPPSSQEKVIIKQANATPRPSRYINDFGPRAQYQFSSAQRIQ